jgi:hypothetical protein
MATTTKELVVYQTPYISLQQDNDLLQMLEEELGGESLSLSSLPRITTPAGGILYWSMGEEEPRRELVGMVIEQHVHRTYWSMRMEEMETMMPPDCSSDDGVTGYSRRDDNDIPLLWPETDGCRECAGCPFARWGSKGKGIACGKRREILFQLPDRPTPIIIDLSPTSAEVFLDFMQKTLLRGIRPSSLEIGLSLERIESGGKISYSRVKVRVVRQLEPVEVVGRQQLAASYTRVKAAQ